MTTEQQEPKVAVVGVASAFVSKINWASIMSLLAIVLGIWNISFSAEHQHNLIVGILAFAGLVDLLVIAFRTWFSTRVTPQSIKGSPVVPAGEPVPAITQPVVAVTVTKEELC